MEIETGKMYKRVSCDTGTVPLPRYIQIYRFIDGGYNDAKCVEVDESDDGVFWSRIDRRELTCEWVKKHYVPYPLVKDSSNRLSKVE